MKIIQFEAENVKKLKVVRIAPKNALVQITGKNGSGKSSVLDSIYWALAGKDAMKGQDQPIRKGEEKAVIKLNLGDIIVTRRFSKSGTTLVVENAEGYKAPKAQAMLDDLIGNLTFDPLEFSRMASKDQFETLRKISDVQVDFDMLAIDDEADRDVRRDINRDIISLEAQTAAIAMPTEAPTEPVNIEDLLAQLNQLEDQNTIVREAEIKRDGYTKQIAETRRLIDAIQLQIAGYETELRALINASDAHTVPAAQSTDDIKSRIAGATAANKAYDAVQKKIALRQSVTDKKDQVLALETRMAQRNQAKIKAVQESKMPIDGLAFGDNEVLFNDIPFIQLSSAEQLRVSVAIAMAANPTLRVIRIKDGSLLDGDGMKMIEEAARDRDYQIWVEKVTDGGKVGIVMEDGEISGDDTEVESAQ